MNTIIFIILTSLIAVEISVMIYLTIRRKKKVVHTEPHVQLSFEQCEIILSTIIDDVYKNKYFLQYRLRDITIIPKMDEEIAKITKDIVHAMSKDLRESYSVYYNEEYLIAMITRRVQMLLVEYTNSFKPTTK